MEITEKDVKVLGRVVAITTDNIVASAELVYDEEFDGGQHLNTINKHFKATDDALNEKTDKLLSYVDKTFVPLSGGVMNDEADLTFNTEDSTSVIDGDGVRVHLKDGSDTVLQANDLHFNNTQCGIKYDPDENTIVVYNGDKTVSLDFDEPCFNAHNITLYADGLSVTNYGPEELVNAGGGVATKITEEQILNLFK